MTRLTVAQQDTLKRLTRESLTASRANETESDQKVNLATARALQRKGLVCLAFDLDLRNERRIFPFDPIQITEEGRKWLRENSS